MEEIDTKMFILSRLSDKFKSLKLSLEKLSNKVDELVTRKDEDNFMGLENERLVSNKGYKNTNSSSQPTI